EVGPRTMTTRPFSSGPRGSSKNWRRFIHSLPIDVRATSWARRLSDPDDRSATWAKSGFVFALSESESQLFPDGAQLIRGRRRRGNGSLESGAFGAFFLDRPGALPDRFLDLVRVLADRAAVIPED